MTTIQKFEEALKLPDADMDVLNPSEDAIVMVDEAHQLDELADRILELARRRL